MLPFPKTQTAPTEDDPLGFTSSYWSTTSPNRNDRSMDHHFHYTSSHHPSFQPTTISPNYFQSFGSSSCMDLFSFPVTTGLTSADTDIFQQQPILPSVTMFNHVILMAFDFSTSNSANPFDSHFTTNGSDTIFSPIIRPPSSSAVQTSYGSPSKSNFGTEPLSSAPFRQHDHFRSNLFTPFFQSDEGIPLATKLNSMAFRIISSTGTRWNCCDEEDRRGILVIEDEPTLSSHNYPIYKVSTTAEAFEIVEQYIQKHCSPSLTPTKNNKFCFLTASTITIQQVVQQEVDSSIPNSSTIAEVSPTEKTLHRNPFTTDLDNIARLQHFQLAKYYFQIPPFVFNQKVERSDTHQSSSVPSNSRLLTILNRQRNNSLNKQENQLAPTGLPSPNLPTSIQLIEKMATSLDAQNNSNQQNYTQQGSEQQEMTASSKKLSILSPSYEPPLHVIQNTIRHERALLQQVDSPLTDEFKTCVVRLRGLPWTSTLSDIAQFFSDFKLAKREEQQEQHSDTSSSDGNSSSSLTGEKQQTISEDDHREEETTTGVRSNSASRTLSYADIVSQGTNTTSNKIISSTSTSSNTSSPRKNKSNHNQQQQSESNIGKDLDILLMLNYYGKSTGEAYVRFENEEELEKARKTMDKKNLGSRYIEIFKSTIEEMEHSRRVLERNMKNLNNSKILKMRNVPFSATEEEIEQFFAGLTIATMNVPNNSEEQQEEEEDGSTIKRKIHFVFNPLIGKRTGEVFVEFISHEEMVQAAKRNKEKIRNRYIELFHSSISELRASQYYVQQQQYYNRSSRPRMHNHFPMHLQQDTNREGQLHSSHQQEGLNFIIKIEGLPSDFEEDRIADWLNGLSISDQGIHLIFGEDECSTGEAFVEFLNEESLLEALQKNQSQIVSANSEDESPQTYIIQVLRSDRTEMLTACGITGEEEDMNEDMPSNTEEVEEQAYASNIPMEDFRLNRRLRYYPPQYMPEYSQYYPTYPIMYQQAPSYPYNYPSNYPYMMPMNGIPNYGMEQPYMSTPKPFKYKLFDHPERTLKMRGLPFTSTEKDIVDFFQGYDFEEDSIRFKMDFKRNRQTGICYIRFRTKTEAERAANERNRCNIGDRYIELFTITPKT